MTTTKTQEEKTPDQKFREAGYVPAPFVRKKIGMSPHTLRAWIAAGDVRAIEHPSQQYVMLADVVRKVGPETCVILNLITADQVKQFKDHAPAKKSAR